MIKLYTYYLTQREPAPGCMPGMGLHRIIDFEERRYIPEIMHEAYARLIYERELTKDEIKGYELIPESYNVRLNRSELRLLSDVLKESAKLHTENADKYYEIYKKLCEALEG